VYHSSVTPGKFEYRREPGTFVLYAHVGIGPVAVWSSTYPSWYENSGGGPP